MKAPPEDLCILMPVWRDYAWLAPITLDLLDKYWPAHPPVFLLGLTGEQAGAMPHFPTTDPTRVGNWSWS